jgi:hypothetical protein
MRIRTGIAGAGILLVAMGVTNDAVDAANAAPQTLGQRMPPGFHWRYVNHRIEDCNGHNRRGRKTIIIWRGNGDLQSAIVCGDGSFWPS